MLTYPAVILITALAYPAKGLILKARELAAAKGGNFRAPHHTVSRAGLAGEMAIAAGGTLLIDEPAEFSRATLAMLESLWAAMAPNVRPTIILTVRASKDPEHTAATLARVVDLFDGWTIACHLTA